MHLQHTVWPADELRKIAETDDLHISPFREDGVTYGTPTWIWSVVVDDGLYVRGYNGQQSRWYQAAIDSLKQVSALREERLDASRESLPTVLTGLLIFGAAITIAYTYLYGVRNIYGQALMTAALASTIGMAIALVLVLDVPFRGGSAISREPFEQSLRLIDHDLD